MENDADDRLSFESGSGANGECWKTHLPVYCDLEEAKISFKSGWGKKKGDTNR